MAAPSSLTSQSVSCRRPQGPHLGRLAVVWIWVALAVGEQPGYGFGGRLPLVVLRIGLPGAGLGAKGLEADGSLG